MRVAILQFAPVLGVLEPNLATILAGVDRAATAVADLFVSSEISLSGCTLRDPELREHLASGIEVMALPALARAAA